MNTHLKEYEPIVGTQILEELYLLAEKAKGWSVQNINSTSVGGGVAEILNRMIPLLQELGVKARWDVIKGGEKFYKVTKKFHNALHGKAEDISPDDFTAFLETGEMNCKTMELAGDIIFVHDPQPITLINRKDDHKGKWIWRCHIDVSNPDQRVWSFLRPFIDRYDSAVFSAPSFGQELPIRQFLIAPSIDPLSDKNKDLPQETIDLVLQKYHLDLAKPMVTQISRFDYLKDPLGVIDAFEIVQQHVDCQLVLAGGEATDDPESTEVLTKTRERAQANPDIHVLAIPSGSDIEINALQRASSVVVQKSIKEGFGLTVAEALWKAKPVVASAVGGITLQVTHKYSGLLSHSVEGAAYAIKQLLQNPDYAKRLGENGREHVRQNFLLTRHLRDYLLVFLSLFHEGDIIHL
ncbi:MAG: glycosyl transferase family 1 [Omnitrophica bacterium RIFCSPHIGHO2_02_FULL_46_11]|nr:MAG: glycosyl transferase family 1 [Omnitrophica bacterium RIFCSPLOWO2_01_FULL_45_10b]OGW87839.1 MAG: glycosyl transferase family 1 [Omnitrophica bacterium RIFCSPHIGHO2_02_FULL_46_11]